MGLDAIIEFKPERPMDNGEVKVLSWRLCDAFGAESFWLDDKSKMAIEACRDGWWSVRQMWRYYGIDYERGPLSIILATCKFVCDYFDGKVVIEYGDDCSGVLGEVTEEFVSILWKHFVKYGHYSYLGVNEKNRCPVCDGPLWDSGYSGGGVLRGCTGCGYSSNRMLL